MESAEPVKKKVTKKKKQQPKKQAKKAAAEQEAVRQMMSVASGAEGGDGTPKNPYIVSMEKGDKCKGPVDWGEMVCHLYTIRTPVGSYPGDYLLVKGWSDNGQMKWQLRPGEGQGKDLHISLPETMVDQSKLKLSPMTAEQAGVADLSTLGVLGGGYKNKKRRSKKRQSKKRRSKKRQSRKRLKTKKR